MWDVEKDVQEAMTAQVTVAQLEELSQAIAAQREACDMAEQVKKAENKKLDDLEKKMMGLLNTAGKLNYHSNVGTISITTRESVRLPQTMEEKMAFFDYLKSKGIFEEMVSVHSATLNSFYKTEKELAAERGELVFSLPGIGEPSRQEILSFRKAK